MPEPKVSININYDAARSQLVGALGAVTQRVTLGLSAVANHPDGVLELPGVFFHMDFSRKPESTVETRLDFESWILGIGLGEGIAAIELFTLEMRRVLAILHSGGQIRVIKTGTRAEILKRFLDAKSRSFERFTWPDRLSELGKLGVSPSVSGAFMSIVGARNCLTHRGGIVGPKDINPSPDENLTVNYYMMQLVSELANGTKIPIDKETHIEAGAGVSVETGVRKSKTFKLGERVLFTAQEFTYLMMTLHAFGTEILVGVSEVQKRMNDEGDSKE